MNHAWVAGAAVLAACVLAAVLGPRSRVHPRLREVVLPADLDAHFAAAESRVAGLRPGCAKGIRWAGKPGSVTPLSIVYLHGYPASRDEIAPVCDRVAGALGANVFYARLAGHGAGPEELARVRADDWFEDANEAWAAGSRIGRRVVVVGMSTGAPLAAWLALNRPETALLVLVSPNFGTARTGARALLWPWGRLLARLVLGRYHELAVENADATRIWTIRSRSEGLAEMAAAADYGRRLPLERLTVPALVVYTANDEVVSVPAILRAYGRMGAARKRLTDLPGAKRHVLAGDALSPGTTAALAAEIVDFASSAGAGPR